MPMSLTTSKQQVITLGQELGKGGEGIVFDVAGHPDQVAKLYHAPNRTAEKAKKLAIMIANPPQDESRSFSPPHVSIAWPLDLLYAQGQFSGFLMPRIMQSPDIFKLYNPTARQKEFPTFDWRYSHRTAQNLAISLQALHMHGYVMGDVNQKNILVTSSALITLVDTDSFQVQGVGGEVYRCPVGVPEYTPPELQGVKFDQIDRCHFHDNFGLAVLIFQLLMEGYHPFTGTPVDPGASIKGEVYLHCIKHGIFPYQSNPAFAPPPNAPDFQILHPELQTLFLRSFVNGHFVPSARPSALEWAQGLASAEKSLIQCGKNLTHWYANPIYGCPWCKRESRNSTTGLSALPNQQPLPARSVSSSPATLPKSSSTTSTVPVSAPIPAIAPPIQNKTFFVKLMRGDFGLAQTYWGFGYGISTLLGFMFDFLETRLPEAVLGFLYFGSLIYGVLVTIGIWRASNKYTGRRIWSILAKIQIILAIVIVILFIIGFIAVMNDLASGS